MTGHKALYAQDKIMSFFIIENNVEKLLLLTNAIILNIDNCVSFGRGDLTRTDDPLHPMQVR
jgi:hypothetical protein